MRPYTANWRIDRKYDFFDALSVDDLAWECLRRYEPYQNHYGALVASGVEALPLSHEAQRRWGLRFPCEAWFAGDRTANLVVTISESRGASARTGAKLPYAASGIPF